MLKRYGTDTFDGKSILVRGTWSDITPDSHRYEEDNSDDGGKTWKPAFVAEQWMEMDGVTTVAKVWNGRGNLAVLESDGPKGHLELLALRLYNPQSHQWSINFATSDVGSLSVPCIDRFKNGFGEFYDQEGFSGRTIQVRFTFHSISPTSAQSEQSFSEDGGKTWEVNWINKYTRVK
jgi:hypothetical protein